MLSPWLGRLERLVKPRLSLLLDHRVAGMLSGLLLVLLGLLLALPIPFTNYIFGSLLLLFALALLERDGDLMNVAWIAGAIANAVLGIARGTLAPAATEWLDRLYGNRPQEGEERDAKRNHARTEQRLGGTKWEKDRE